MANKMFGIVCCLVGCVFSCLGWLFSSWSCSIAGICLWIVRPKICRRCLRVGAGLQGSGPLPVNIRVVSYVVRCAVHSILGVRGAGCMLTLR
jgi:hypothetical protein